MAETISKPPLPPHALSAESVVASLGTDPQCGLSADDVQERLERFGPNELDEPPGEPRWRKLASQFAQPVIWLLLIAAGLSGVVAARSGSASDWIETSVIVAIVVMNGILGFVQEERAEVALAALRRLAAPLANVVRGGRPASLPARELVPGDRIEIGAGDSIPADARLTRAAGLLLQEAALTGESGAVAKSVKELPDASTPLACRANMVYAGTVAVAGRGTAIVTATGMQTEVGRIAGLLGQQKAEPTPLERRLAELGRVLIAVCVTAASVIFVMHLFRGGSVLDTLLLSVSLVVAAVPEGLPAVVTIVLAIGMQRMARRHALVRSLPAVETLGCVTVICSDKTGTLTRNEMTLREIAIGRARWSFESCQGVSDPDVLRALEIGAFCNSARLLGGEQDKEKIRWLGDPTEGALLVAAVQAGLLPRAEEPQTLHELPFDSERRAMSIVLRLPEEGLRMYTKGAAETVLEFCNSEWAAGQRQPLEPGRIEEIRETEGRMAAEGLRVLAVAFKELRGDEPDAFQEKRLTFVGLAGLNDPPRPEVRAAVLKARQAGIRTVMITGDHPATARAIARELHMCREEDEAVSGAELDKLTDEELAGRVEAIAVYSRVTAHHKLRVVRAWKARGQIVAMTGDGVNDAAAVKIADVGIAMGVSGTDVTRGASDIVLTDDNFASIVAAVEQGRTVLENIQKFLHFQLAGNVGGVLVMFIAALAGLPPPLTAIHLLWINLILDGLPALALGLEPPEMDVMTRPPRPPREPVIAWELGTRILRHGALIGLVVMTGFLLTLAEGGSTLHAQTIAFALLAFTRIAFSFCCRSQRRTMPVLGILSNPHLAGALALSGALQCVVLGATWARAAFGVSVLPLAEWLLVLALALVPVTLIELNKVRSAGQAPGHVGIVPRESRKSANG